MRHCRLYKRFRNPLAFTLVELVVVIALMAILASAVAPTINRNIFQTSESKKKDYFEKEVSTQVDEIVRVYNVETAAGRMPRIAGYNLNTARGILECLRSANNHSDVYDIELITVAEAPDPTLYNYIDTIVVCIQFYADGASEPIKNAKGIPCSPEQATGGVIVRSCKVVNMWYVKKDESSYSAEWQVRFR